MPERLRMLPLVRLAAAGALILAFGCGEAPAADQAAAGSEAAPAAPGAAAAGAAPPAGAETAGPPLGRYVCRQHTTTMGYLSLEAGGEYEVSGVRGRYRFDPQTGDMDWQGGSYAEWGWEGTYEHVAREEGDGRPDEDIIRLEGDGLQIACYLMED